MYTVSVQAHYDSAHFLRNYKGKCERLHGHATWWRPPSRPPS
jgi:6-pyruvoyltetrahydropterin/6-carboxytetrahydropterin synthase